MLHEVFKGAETIFEGRSSLDYVGQRIGLKLKIHLPDLVIYLISGITRVLRIHFDNSGERRVDI